MSEQSLQTLLLAVGMAAFERTPDGGFTSLGPLPPWLRRVTGDGTFPFLGHVLDDVHAFLGSGIQGVRDFGPCADVDETGEPFHYMVTAATLGDQRFLVLRRDSGSDRIQQMLQSAREQALLLRENARAADLLATLRGEVRWQRDAVQEFSARLLKSDLTDEQRHLVMGLIREMERLVERVAGTADRPAAPDA
jgi:hypothetical protein